MIFTNPILESPQRQLTTGRIPVRSTSVPPVTTYTIDSTVEEELSAFLQVDLSQDDMPWAYMLKFRLNHPADVGDVTVELEGLASEPVAGWNMKPHTDFVDHTMHQGAVYNMVGRDHLMLISKRYLLESVRIRIHEPSALQMDWLMFERVIGVVHPTLAYQGSLARARKATKTITGQSYTTTASPDRVFSAPLKLTNEWRPEVTALLQHLEDITVFGVDPCGAEAALIDSEILYARNGFTRNMQIASTYKGIYGDKGISALGGSGKMELRESAFTGPVPVRRPTTDDDRFIRVTPDGFRRVTIGGHLRSWRI